MAGSTMWYHKVRTRVPWYVPYGTPYHGTLASTCTYSTHGWRGRSKIIKKYKQACACASRFTGPGRSSAVRLRLSSDLDARAAVQHVAGGGVRAQQGHRHTDALHQVEHWPLLVARQVGHRGAEVANPVWLHSSGAGHSLGSALDGHAEHLAGAAGG
jgi:hypothetical protein